ncbi:reverse transcriptase [Gigaspora margarita]|uniref:Reverse transcriptase n=1 Tax=Gigaspora margarita TaxID=4874 RepID=A0A8H4AUM5_GIGMA|nr:reverse transcriptase [Gigaspora margarita]
MTKRTNTQNTIINWLLQAKQQNLYPIILGDFNTQDNAFSSSSKYKLINFLHRSNMFDIGAHLNNTHYTWSNNISSTTSTYQWSEFSEHCSNLFIQYNIPLSTDTQENINTTWHKIQHCIIQAAIHTIPNKISQKRSYNYKYTSHCTALHTGLKKLSHLIKTIKNNNNFQASEKRCETLVSKPTQAINSILDRYQIPVHFSNIKLDNQLVTNPIEIKQHIQSHFHNWISYKPINQTTFNNFWLQQYTQPSHINPSWYTSLTSSITEDKVLQTIAKLPNSKACGPAGNLNLTHSISLIKYSRKLYTKILTNRLNQVFLQHPILLPYNYVALPGNSTSIPIHILNNLVEDANCNHKEIWILSQDMSKAYDSVNFTLLKQALHRLALPTSITSILTDQLVDRQNQVITNLCLTLPYQVQNGIDQGETITPLLWRIYYDPLITYIHTNSLGYTTETS